MLDSVSDGRASFSLDGGIGWRSEFNLDKIACLQGHQGCFRLFDSFRSFHITTDAFGHDQTTVPYKRLKTNDLLLLLLSYIEQHPSQSFTSFPNSHFHKHNSNLQQTSSTRRLFLTTSPRMDRKVGEQAVCERVVKRRMWKRKRRRTE